VGRPSFPFPPPGSPGARGIGLVELLVALALFVLLAGLALTRYESARRALKRGSGQVEAQQSLRAGLDRVASDLRAAGRGIDPDGEPARPDEGVEAALAAAVVIRADFDGRTERATDPETELAGGGRFARVPTGNDEIVAYALARADGTSADRFHFDADVEGVPRDGLVERVVLAGLALGQDDPPYTLYRLTVRPDSSRVARTPVIDGVRRLRFTYFDGAGEVVPPPGGEDDAAARRGRASIRRVRIELEWVSSAGGRSEGFRLAACVTPRNLRLVASPPPS